MQIQLLVTVTVAPSDPQPIKEFNKDDGKAMYPYLVEKISDSLQGSYQYNAYVTRVKITAPRKRSIRS